MTTYSEAVEQTITAGEQIHQIVNGTATTEVTVEDGSKVPSIRKALLDNFYFKDPIAWQVGQTENVFNQLRQFTDGSWWYAPSATASNPVSMGSTPVGNPLWKVYSFDAIGKLTPQIREALRRSYAEAGYNLVSGSFEAGGTLVDANDVLLQERTGKAFSGPAGVVSSGTDPTSGGFVDKSGVATSASAISNANGGSVQDFIDNIDQVHTRTVANVDAMLAFNGLVVGQRYSTGGTTWEYLGGGGADINNFKAINHLYLKDFGVVGSAVVEDINEQGKIQACINYAYSKGIRDIKGSGLTVGITKIVLKSVILDMEGGHLYRVTGGSLLSMRSMVTAGDYSAPNFDNSGLINCHVTGTGAEEGVNDQGHAIGMYNCENFLIENVTTDNTNGDGIATRSANGQMNNVKIGSFGRNGISPTSGIIYYNKVDIIGPVLAGANPGKYFDSEINDNTEVSEHYIDGLTSKGMTFVDLNATAGQKFAIKVQMRNCRLGGAYRTLRFESNQPSVDADIFVDGSNIIETVPTGGTGDNTGIEIKNVSGVTIGPVTVRNNGATTARLIKIVGEVKQLTLQKPYLSGTFSIDCVGTGVLSDSNLSFAAAPRMYLQGSNNVISADSFARIDLNLSTTVNNKFFINGPYSTVDIKLSGGARSEDQYFPKNLADSATRIIPQGDIIYTKSQFQSSGVVQNMDVYIPVAGVYKLIVKTGSSSTSYAYKEFLVHFNPTSGALTLMQTLRDFVVGACTIQNPVGNVGYISIETSSQLSSNCSVTVIG